MTASGYNLTVQYFICNFSWTFLQMSIFGSCFKVDNSSPLFFQYRNLSQYRQRQIKQGQSYLMRRSLFSLEWPHFLVWCHNKNTLWGRWGRCFITWGSLAPHLFLLDWLKLSMNHLISCEWLMKMNAGGSCVLYAYHFLALFYLRPDLLTLEDTGIGVFWLLWSTW